MGRHPGELQTKGLDFINFNIPGAGVHRIVLGAQLFLNDQVVIDGTTQPGYNGQPLIYVQAGINPTPTLFTLQDESQWAPGGDDQLGIDDPGTRDVSPSRSVR